MKQTLFFGFNSINSLKKIIKTRKINRVFLVNDRESYSLCGAKDKIEEILKTKIKYEFNDFKPNPHMYEVKEGIKKYREQGNFDCIIAVGGGTAIDMAKLINILSHQANTPVEIIQKKKPIQTKGKFLIAIPTTAGTGSEATHFAVIYIEKKKYSVSCNFMRPDISIIDPNFHRSLPPYITACTGMDALAQAIESFWSINSTSKSRVHSKKAIKLILRHLYNAVHKPSKANRLNLAKAAYLAGRAIDITKTTAPHAFSYYFTSFKNISHGHAVGLMLGRFMIYNYNVSNSDIEDKRGVYYVKKNMERLFYLLNVNDAISAKNKINEIMKAIGLKTDLKIFGFEPECDLPAFIESINLERLKNNPRKVTEKDVAYLLSL